jgi:hypothetical protein
MITVVQWLEGLAHYSRTLKLALLDGLEVVIFFAGLCCPRGQLFLTLGVVPICTDANDGIASLFLLRTHSLRVINHSVMFPSPSAWFESLSEHSMTCQV